jgi:hypothetical protein
MRWRPFSKEEVERIIRMADAKNDVPSIASVLGRNRSAIRTKLKELGIAVPKQDRHRVYSPKQVELIRLMHRNGHGGNSIARALNVTPQSLRWKCIDLGIKLRKPRVDNRVYVSINAHTMERLRAAADEHGMTPNGLVRQLVEQIVRDNLYSAVIDAPATPRKAKAIPSPHVRTVPSSPPADIALDLQPMVATLSVPELCARLPTITSRDSLTVEGI